MTVPAAYAISADSLTAETFRQAPSSLISGTGVVGSGDLAVTQNGTPNLSVNVAAGQVWVPGTLASTSGFPNNANAQTAYGLPSAFNEQASYYGWNNGTVNLTIAAADPTNPRIDIVCASVQDAQYSGASNQMVLQVITGTPAASPSAPSAPASSVVIAQVAVAANTTTILTANITDERPVLAPAVPVSAPRGVVARGSVTAVTSAISSGSVTWVSTSAFTTDGTRRFAVWWSGLIGASVAGNLAIVELKDGSTLLGVAQVVVPGTGGPNQVTATGFWEGVLSAGAHTLTMALAFGAGSGTIQGESSTTAPAALLAMDVGT